MTERLPKRSSLSPRLDLESKEVLLPIMLTKVLIKVKERMNRFMRLVSGLQKSFLEHHL